jgi:ABC-type cobalamin/Fe3+-siderophores transport system ATPase subunit
MRVICLPILGAGASVSLSAIKDVRAVNNLAPEQTLSFAPNGVTIVYGDNGAGKSGYARILKRAPCPSFGSDPLQYL